MKQKVTINKKDFIQGLSIGGSFAGRAKALPILDCVKIKVKKNCMNIISSDNENAISKKVDFIESSFEGEFCVSLKSLNQYVKLVSGEFIELVISDDFKTLEIKHKKGSLSLPLSDADEFPMVKTDGEGIEFSIDATILHNWVVDAKDFVAYDEFRPQLNGIYIYRRDSELGCCSSDGHKMYYNHIADENTDSFEFVINRNSVSSVCNICKSTDTVTVNVGQTNTMFIGNGITLISRNLTGRYPNFKSVIPNDNHIEVISDCAELKEAILRCTVGASQTTSLIKLDIQGTMLTLSAEDIDFSVKSVETMFVESNKDVAIGFKADYLLDILNTINTPKCLIKLKDPTRAGLFHECEDGKVCSSKLSLLMPMTL